MEDNYVLLSHRLRQTTPSYCDRDRFIIRKNTSISAGDTANTSCWILTNDHIGTHIDVPKHFSDTGKCTFDYPIDHYIFNNIYVFEYPCERPVLIGKSHFESLEIDPNVELILISTGFEKIRLMNKFWSHSPGLDPELADYLRERFPKLRCVGFDFISITSLLYREEGRAAHRNFLCPSDGKKEILVIEDMMLEHAKNGLQEVIVAPLFAEDGNGGPVTVIGKY